MKRQILYSVLLAIVAMMMFALPQYAQAQTKEAYVVKSELGQVHSLTRTQLLPKL